MNTLTAQQKLNLARRKRRRTQLVNMLIAAVIALPSLWLLITTFGAWMLPVGTLAALLVVFYEVWSLPVTRRWYLFIGRQYPHAVVAMQRAEWGAHRFGVEIADIILRGAIEYTAGDYRVIDVSSLTDSLGAELTLVCSRPYHGALTFTLHDADGREYGTHHQIVNLHWGVNRVDMARHFHFDAVRPADTWTLVVTLDDIPIAVHAVHWRDFKQSPEKNRAMLVEGKVSATDGEITARAKHQLAYADNIISLDELLQEQRKAGIRQK